VSVPSEVFGAQRAPILYRARRVGGSSAWGFGFRNFENYRIRALLDAGRPNWRVPGSIVVR
jgi:hypothetical protein